MIPRYIIPKSFLYKTASELRVKMFTLTKELDFDIEDIAYTEYKKNEVVFFDIETTGFSPETTILYMIGCIYYQQNRLICTQWFSDTKEAQEDVLKAFFEFISKYKLLICYNGIGFDMPYLIKKCKIYELEYSFDNIDCLDIYKSINPFRAFLKTENMKQKSMEQFLGIHREDKYTGGELIDFYIKYLKNNSKELLDILALHNHDDLIGMTTLLKLLSYPALFNGNFHIKGINSNAITLLDQSEGKEIKIDITLEQPVPRRISFGNESFYLTIAGDSARLTIKAYTKELKYFYSNYKDYYYLPNEDTAIHKSIAFYVDKNFRTKAKAANCYSKKTGCFLPQYEEIVCPYFKIDYYDKITYFEFTDEFKSDNELISKYFLHIAKRLLSE